MAGKADTIGKPARELSFRVEHQIRTLIVENDSGPHPAFAEQFSGSKQKCSFPSA